MNLDMLLYLLYWAVVYNLVIGVTVLFYVGVFHLAVVWPLRAYRRRAAQPRQPQFR